MSIKDRISSWFSRKDSAARIINSLTYLDRAVPLPANYESFAKKGYGSNVIVFACIQKIAQGIGGLKWEVFSRRAGTSDLTQVIEGPLVTLLQRPNPMQATGAFFEAMAAFYVLTGNTYVDGVAPTPKAPPLELWINRPDRMHIMPNAQGYPGKYVYKFGGKEKIYETDFVKMISPILHVKTFNPLNDWYGMAPLEAAVLSLSQNNQGSMWNLALLQNQATPSGVLQMKVADSNPRGELTNEQYTRLKAEFEQWHQGARNAGRPMILEGGLMWQQISQTLRDMEYMKGKEFTAIELALVFGIPPEILGLGQKIYNNYREARLAMYEDAILPIADLFAGELTRWLAPSFGENLIISYDKNAIEALAYKREMKFATVKDATFLTQNEKREAVGYDTVDGWDVFLIGNQLLENPEDAQGGGDPEDEEEEETDPNKNPEDDKKPGDEEETEEEPEDGDEEEQDESEKGFKAFNLVNANERRKSWRRQNARKDRLEKSFKRDLNEDLRELNTVMVNAAKSTDDARLMTYAMVSAAGEFMPVIEKTLKRHIRYTVNEFGGMILDQGKAMYGIGHKANLRFDSFVEAFVKRRTGDAITKIEGTTKKQVERVVKRLTEEAILDGQSGADLTKDLLDEFNSLTPGRSRLIARTEVQVASNNASREAVKSLQIPNMQKEWVPAGDGRVRNDSDHADHEAMNGVKVGIDDNFTVPPDTSMDGPGDASAPAEQVCNCRCVLVFSNNTRF